MGRTCGGLCPFHDDREPSLVVTPAKNLWHCLGACQTGGTVIDWVMRAQGVSFRHAVELLRTDAAFTAVPTQAKHSTVVKLPPPVDREAGDAQLLSQVAHFYHETLKGSPEALAHLQQRGLTDAEVISGVFSSAMPTGRWATGCGRRTGRRGRRCAGVCRS